MLQLDKLEFALFILHDHVLLFMLCIHQKPHIIGIVFIHREQLIRFSKQRIPKSIGDILSELCLLHTIRIQLPFKFTRQRLSFLDILPSFAICGRIRIAKFKATDPQFLHQFPKHIEPRRQTEQDDQHRQKHIDRIANQRQHTHIMKQIQIRIRILIGFPLVFVDGHQQKVVSQRKHEAHGKRAVGQHRRTVGELERMHMIVLIDMDAPQRIQRARRQIRKQQDTKHDGHVGVERGVDQREQTQIRFDADKIKDDHRLAPDHHNR
mmetsp:Transcript_5592/g.9385  ORF Transcript_5592/g.9385 Transcript_5592/m.9385 type:complete len:265 (+) Transcript_5592:109-903(+)